MKRKPPVRAPKVVAAVKRDLEALGSAVDDHAALAASALALARELDNPKNSATSKAACSRALAETMDRLRALRSADGDRDRVDELGARRETRRAGQSGS